MVLRIKKKEENRIFKVYMLAMFSLFIARYLFEINVPAIVFLAVAMIPICFGSVSEQMAFVASCIPFSIAFQYKYAILILTVVILFKNQWRLKRSGAFIIIMFMMVWELCHAYYGGFSYVEYLRDFAELILLGVITSINIKDVDYKLVIRSLAVSVVGVCIIMLIMQLQQHNFNLVAVFARSAKHFRFGQSNMEAGDFALNFNANNLGFICNLSACGCMLLASRKEHSRTDIVLAILSIVFAMMTMSRAAIVCSVIIIIAFLILTEGKFINKIFSGIGGIAVAIAAVILIWILVPSVFENILERFQRADVWNGRGELLKYYGEFLMSSWKYFMFGIGMQNIFEKVSPYFPVHNVPHMGFQEVWVAWGIVGVVIILIVLWKIVTTSKYYADGKRQLYQFMPLGLTLLFTMSGQLLTSSRSLIALSFAYICLCVGENTSNTQNTQNLEKQYE
ncbi:MAG: O-antigen ligase family protein [Oscillospiraceae bacterium]|nr:O-antigen ligase family protein [Oscillospiraceae bacterium]